MQSNKNLSQIAYEEIKQMILSGELKQGQAFSINAMTERLRISRTPLTNACQRLESERLLTVLPKQGALVNTISIETACGIYELRAAIESYNAKRVFELLDQRDIAFLESSIEHLQFQNRWFHLHLFHHQQNHVMLMFL